MLAFVVICVILGGVFGDEACSYFEVYETCRHHIPFDKMNAIEGVPNEEELISICPEELEYFQCLSETAKDCLKNEAFEFIDAGYKVVSDLCNEDTSLHKNYIANAECYKTLKSEALYCRDSASLIYHEYREFQEKEHPEKLEELDETGNLGMCITQSYIMACIAEKVQKTCGDLAASTMLELVNRSQSLREYCSSTMMEEMKTYLLERLGLESDDRDIYKNAFSFIKK